MVSAVVIFSAVEGVEAQSRNGLEAGYQGIHRSRLCFINKMDRIGAEFDRVFHEISERLESHPIPHPQIPIGRGSRGNDGRIRKV